jgi:hypothetical protein
MTVIVAMSASGQFIPSLIIFPRKNMNNQQMRGSPPGAVGVVHPLGWVQAHIFAQRFMHFLKKVKPSENSPALLILDCHYSHTHNVEVITSQLSHYLLTPPTGFSP